LESLPPQRLEDYNQFKSHGKSNKKNADAKSNSNKNNEPADANKTNKKSQKIKGLPKRPLSNSIVSSDEESENDSNINFHLKSEETSGNESDNSPKKKKLN
jgi:hypothetical protein